MYIKIRKLGAKPGEDDLTLEVSRTAKIQELRGMIFDEWDIEVDKQRLYYKGKQLIDDHDLYEYGVHLNEVIQLMICADVAKIEDKDTSENKESVLKQIDEIEVESAYYKVGDRVDMRDLHGAWFEAKISKIIQNHVLENDDTKIENDLIFKCNRESEADQIALELKFDDIRPRAYHTYKQFELKTGMLVMVNHNMDEPKDRGYWYDFKITQILSKTIKGTILFGLDKTPIENTTCKFIDEVLRIEPHILLNEQTVNEHLNGLPLRKIPFNCVKCKDNPDKKCKGCGCKVCFGKNNIENILLCDECDGGYHIGCLTPPLTEIPKENEWYCPACKTDENEIVKAGDKLKFSKKKSKMPSAKDESGSSRDWGKGMACLGRSKECTMVSKNHLGPIPGVDVGTCWKYRIQVSEAGIHRPLVAGIHGRESDFAYSIVLSGGYEDDIDNGDEFYYTGSGGRDLSGNKRVSEQSCDQLLTRMNKSLTNNCNAKFNLKDGAESDDWKKGKPIRVVRNCKGAKHSKYAPKEGNRYDGIYKIVKYYPEKGKSGFIVWRYLLRRDDPNPAPWDEGGQEFDIIYPDGYLEAQEKKNNAKEATKRGIKRVLSDSSNTPTPKKTKNQIYKLPNDIVDNINKDSINSKVWLECKQVLIEGKVKFLSKVEELFMCICCQEIVFMPITTECTHNICKSCLKRSFSSDIHSCPSCRFDLGKDYEFKINQILGDILLALFPGYDKSR